MKNRSVVYALANTATLLTLAAAALFGCGKSRGFAAHTKADIQFATQNIPSIGINNRHYKGIGVVRRDPSDVIKLDGTYYVFYARAIHSDWDKYGWKARRYLASGYYGTIWYATSKDGKKWTERGEALGRGMVGKFDSNGVFSPNVIRAADGKVYMYYTGVPKGFENNNTTDYTYMFGAELTLDNNGSVSGTTRLNRGDPILSPTARQTHNGTPLFDSYRVDDAALLWRDYDADGDLELGLYFKGRAQGDSPAGTKLGVAVAESPEGPFVRHANSRDGRFAQNHNHEVLVFAFGQGVISIGSMAGKGLGVLYDNKGVHFARTAAYTGRIFAPGAYRPELTDRKQTSGVTWGISMMHSKDTPYLVRWDVESRGGAKSPWLGAVPSALP